MPWLEIRINTNREDALAYDEALVAAGAQAVTLQDNADQPIFEPELGEMPLWKDTRITGLFDADIDTKSVEKTLEIPKEAFFLWHLVEDKDWEREWMKHYKPIQCSDQLWICPSWMDPPDPNATNLLLDPGLAFGTGTHPTTFLCLQWLSDQSFANAKVIDYGCGSGILGIASLLLGATQVTGIDIDPQALLATQENTRRNGLATHQFPVFFPEKAPQEEASLLLANILAGPLVELAGTLELLLKPGGLLCLSGILSSQASTVQKVYENFIDFDPVHIKDDWVCLTGQKKC